MQPAQSVVEPGKHSGMVAGIQVEHEGANLLEVAQQPPRLVTVELELREQAERVDEEHTGRRFAVARRAGDGLGSGDAGGAEKVNAELDLVRAESGTAGGVGVSRVEKWEGGGCCLRTGRT